MSTARELFDSISNLAKSEAASAARGAAQTVTGTFQGRDAEGKPWVMLDGADSATPIGRMAVSAEVGDVVSVTISDGTATVDANVSNPSATGTATNAIDRKATVAQATAEQAIDYASQASAAASDAQSSADSAAAAASQAQADAEAVHGIAEQAQADAASATTAASAAVSAADAAQDAANAANDNLKSVVQGATTVEKAVSVMQTALEAVVDYDPTTDTTQEWFWHDANGAHVLGDTSGYRNDITSSGMDIRQVSTEDSVASFGANGSRIGKYDGSHLDMDSRNINLIDEFGNSYFKMSDLRNYAGWASLNEVFYGNGTKTQFDVSFSVYIVFGVRVDGVSVSFTPPASSYSRTVTLDAAPSSGARIVIAYSTESEFAKAFTIGRRNADASIGGYSYAEGFDVDASGSYSHAEGRDTHSVGIGSHAEGNETEACGDDSHAEGHWTQARGAHSHSEGFFSVASGDNSHAQNRYTIAASTDQTAIGRMNVEDANGTYALIVGNGDQLQGTRSNALTVDWDGNVTPYGNMYSCMKDVDTSLANNGVSSSFYRNFGIRDKNNRYTLFCQTGAMTDGSVRAEFAARNFGTGANITNLIRLIVDNAGNRSVELSVPSAWRTALQGAREILKSSTLDRDDSTNPSASVWSDSDVYFYDKDDEPLGYIRIGRGTTGAMVMRLQVNNEPFGGGTVVNNSLEIAVRRDGTRVYSIGDPAAFRSALALNTWTTVAIGDFATAASGWSFASGCNIQYNEALGALRVRIQVTTSAAQTAGQKTLFTVKTAYRPKTFAASISSLTAYAQAGQIYTTGGFAVNISAISANTSLYFNGVYFIGA